MRFITGILLLSATGAGFSAFSQTKKLIIATGLQASISHTEGSKTVQVLMPGVEAIELELSQPPGTNFQIRTADYNFDGYKDFAFVGTNASTLR